MDRLILLFFLVIVFSLDSAGNHPRKTGSESPLPRQIIQDKPVDKQLLYNGRIWKSLYSNIRGGEFLFTQDWLEGEVVINDTRFTKLLLKYDIYNDELICMINPGMSIRLNKELITEFGLNSGGTYYRYEKPGDYENSRLTGFARPLYKGETSLYLKQSKEIKEKSIDNRYDEFVQNDILFLIKEGVPYRLSGKKEFYRILSDRENEVKNYARENRIRVRKKFPESFVKVLSYYDSLKK
jgi:hypothetical protein